MDYKETYLKWLNEPTLDLDLKEALKKLSEKEIEEAFYKNIEFGTAGARGIMGPGTNKLNLYTIKKMTLGFAKYIKKVAKTTNYSVAISYDNRNNSKYFAYVAAGVLASEGIKTFITKNLRPTPFLSYMVRHFGCDGGIMITASHNPKEYNGFKVYDRHGGQLVPEDALILVKEVEKIKDYFYIQEYKNDNFIKEVDEDLDEAYLSHVKKIQLSSFDSKPLNFIYSPLHGTGGTLIVKLLKRLGYNIFPVTKQMVVDGDFKDAPSSNPEDLQAYELGLIEAKKHQGDLILVTDPDADRLGIMVKQNDDYIFLNGNQTAALELYYILSRKNELNTLDKDGIVYMSNVTTPLIKDIAKTYDIEVSEVLPGFKFIGQAIRNTNRSYLFGAEESYGSLVSPFVRDKDAVQAVLLLVEMATYYHKLGKTLYDILNELYETYGFYAEKTISLNYEGISGAKKIQKIMKHVSTNDLTLKNEVDWIKEDYLLSIKTVDQVEERLPFESSDILRYIYKSGNIAIIRPSGTEPKLKVYLYIKGKTSDEALTALTNIEKEIINQIEGV